jgi:hypothetical protein
MGQFTEAMPALSPCDHTNVPGGAGVGQLDEGGLVDTQLQLL